MLYRHRVLKAAYLVFLFLFSMNRCDEDSTVERHAIVRKTQFRFSMEAFKFIGIHNQVKNGLLVRLQEVAVNVSVIPIL